MESARAPVHRQTPFVRAVQELLERITRIVFDGKPLHPKIRVIVAGGTAVHLYLGNRVSKDLDAEFVARMRRPEVVVSYMDGPELRTVHLDVAYFSTLGVMHEDYVDRVRPTGLFTEAFDVFVLDPVDLAISKLGRWAENDRADVSALVEAGLIEPGSLKRLAEEALSYDVGNVRPVESNLADAMAYFPASPDPSP